MHATIGRLSLASVVLLCCAACTTSQTGDRTAGSSAARGEYLVSFGGCHDCHTPKLLTPGGPVADSTRLLSGHPAGQALPAIPEGVIGPNQWGALATNDFTAWAGPWGVSFAANLTPDATGLGSWTEEQFIASMRTGRHMGSGRPILPPMPWFEVATLTDEDLRAVYAYLRSIRPVRNPVPAPIPPATTP